MNAAFSRQMGALTLTRTWLNMNFATREALVEDIENCDSVEQLTKEHQQIVRAAERELTSAVKFVRKAAWN